MADDQTFALPYSGYDQVKKILHAYVLCGDKEVALAEVSQKAGMNKTTVSSNNGFLASVGIIEGGWKKKLTACGKTLAIATSHDDQEATAAAWRKIVTDSQHLRGVVDMIRVQGGVAQSNLTTKIASHFGLPGGKGTTGLNTVVDMLVDAGVITAEGEKYVVAKTRAASVESASTQSGDGKNKKPHGAPTACAAETQTQLTRQVRGGAGAAMVPIHINIELHLPASAEQAVYDAIFKSIRQNLMESGDGLSDAS